MHILSGELIIPKDAPDDLIRAAGGIITRTVLGGRVEVACIYRESRGDWTFPKGKLDEGETFEQAAIREVLEETGMKCEVIRFIGSTNYIHRKGKSKIVAYYLFFQLLLPPRFLSFLTRKGSRLVLFFLCLVIKVEKVPIVVTYQSFCPAFHFSSEASRYLSFKNRRLFLSPFSWSV